jgi:hypothetical protein
MPRRPKSETEKSLNDAFIDAVIGIRGIRAGIKAKKYHPKREFHLLMEVEAVEETLNWLSKETEVHGRTFPL